MNALEELTALVRPFVKKSKTHTDAVVALTDVLNAFSTQRLVDAMNCKPNLWTVDTSSLAPQPTMRWKIIQTLMLYFEFVLDDWPVDAYSAPGDEGANL